MGKFLPVLNVLRRIIYMVVLVIGTSMRFVWRRRASDGEAKLSYGRWYATV